VTGGNSAPGSTDAWTRLGRLEGMR
jgi:hypothetical protein